MQNRSTNEECFPLEYLSIVSSLVKRFPDLERDEALSVGYEAMIRAQRTFLRLHGKGDCYGYIYRSVQNAFKRACYRKAKENAVTLSLEKLAGDVERGEGIYNRVFSDPCNTDEHWELYERIEPFLKHLDAADRVIFLFRWTHPDISLKQTAHMLSCAYPHLRIPKKQSGLTKRLQKLKTLYKEYMSEDA
ncbi:MAG TPA: hypothetical protein VKY19_00065 [Ktedonosporobacter sp.]|jgi:DNA-directed RNA polymerase specialized sigma24 family protein|nr:hypothetical protein [Ktedonosporobacter sp.]